MSTTLLLLIFLSPLQALPSPSLSPPLSNLSRPLSPLQALPSRSFSPLLSNLKLVGSGEADCDGEEVKQCLMANPNNILIIISIITIINIILKVKRCWMATLNTEVLEEAGMVLPGGQTMVVEAREGHTVILSLIHI